MEQSVVSERVEVIGRLDELGLRPELLSDAVDEGCRHVRGCTLNDPAQLPGLLGWGKVTRAFRDRYIPLKWKRESVRSQATTVSPDGRVSIVVAGGDVNTGGDSDNPPTTRSAKGPVTKDAVASNQRSFAEINPEFARVAEETGTRTYLLLYFIDEDQEEIRVELSLPTHIHENGYVSEWRERIVLSPIPINREQPPISDEEDDEEVTVTRRAAV